MPSVSLVVSECSSSGRGRGHVSNFYIVDLEKVVGCIHNSTGRRFVYDTYETMKATRTCHG